MQNKSFKLKTIGYVKNEKGEFSLNLDEKWKEAMKELDGFSHIQVVWWCHEFDTEEMRQYTVSNSPYKNAPENIGIFATRSPVRPNPIAITAVPVISIDHKNGEIKIPFIDANDGTPILDIKPYHPATERIKNVKVPEWCNHWPKWYEDSATFDWAGEFINAQ